MFKISKIDKLVFKGFVGPYIMAFLVAEFVLVMQFLWKEIEDISGKGVGMLDILELMFYFSISLIPQAIPIAILLSSVFVFGNLSEKFELTSLKSAGISLLRIMRMGIILGVLTMGVSLLASNYLVPKSNFVFFKRFYTIKKQKPTMSIEAGMFNDDFNGFSIYAKSKGKDNKSLYNVMLYDQVNDGTRFSMTTAKKGEMIITDDGRFLMMRLQNGEQYRELEENKIVKKDPSQASYPFMRTRFGEWEKFFDMAEFELDTNSVSLERKKYDMLNALQLQVEIDSINSEINNNILKTHKTFEDVLLDSKTNRASKQNYISDSPIKNRKSTSNAKPNNKRKSKKKKKKFDTNKVIASQSIRDTVHTIIGLVNPTKQKNILKLASSKVKRITNQTKIIRDKVTALNRKKDIYTFKMHSKFSWALICLIFLFIGAPFGSIIRKGGYGYPLLMSIVFFMMFILLAIMGEKLSRSAQMEPILAAWLPCLVLLPFAVFFTIKAINDSSLKEYSFILKLKNYFRGT